MRRPQPKDASFRASAPNTAVGAPSGELQSSARQPPLGRAGTESPAQRRAPRAGKHQSLRPGRFPSGCGRAPCPAPWSCRRARNGWEAGGSCPRGLPVEEPLAEPKTGFAPGAGSPVAQSSLTAAPAPAGRRSEDPDPQPARAQPHHPTEEWRVARSGRAGSATTPLSDRLRTGLL